MQDFIDSMKPEDKVIMFVGKKLTYVITSQYYSCSFLTNKYWIVS